MFSRKTDRRFCKRGRNLTWIWSHKQWR